MLQQLIEAARQAHPHARGTCRGLKDSNGIMGRFDWAAGPSDTKNLAKMKTYATALKDGLRAIMACALAAKFCPAAVHHRLTIACWPGRSPHAPLVFFHEYQG